MGFATRSNIISRSSKGSLSEEKLLSAVGGILDWVTEEAVIGPMGISVLDGSSMESDSHEKEGSEFENMLVGAVRESTALLRELSALDRSSESA